MNNVIKGLKAQLAATNGSKATLEKKLTEQYVIMFCKSLVQNVIPEISRETLEGYTLLDMMRDSKQALLTIKRLCKHQDMLKNLCKRFKPLFEGLNPEDVLTMLENRSVGIDLLDLLVNDRLHGSLFMGIDKHVLVDVHSVLMYIVKQMSILKTIGDIEEFITKVLELASSDKEPTVDSIFDLYLLLYSKV